MKKMYLWSAILGMLLSCENKGSSKIHNENLTKDVADIIYDSVRFQKNENVGDIKTEFNHKLLVFKDLDESVLEEIYGTSEGYTKEELEKKLAGMQRRFVQEMENYESPAGQTLSSIKEMDLVNEINNYLIIRQKSYTYEGGAHGMSFIEYKVIDSQKNSILKLHDAVDENDENWNKILLKMLDGRASELFDPEDLKPSENFYFDKDRIIFVYNQYEIAPYSSGIIEISVPFSEISDKLRPQFKRRLGID